MLHQKIIRFIFSYKLQIILLHLFLYFSFSKSYVEDQIKYNSLEECKISNCSIFLNGTCTVRYDGMCVCSVEKLDLNHRYLLKRHCIRAGCEILHFFCYLNSVSKKYQCIDIPRM